MSGCGFIEVHDKETNRRHSVPVESIQSVDEEEDGGAFVSFVTYESGTAYGILTVEAYNKVKEKLYEARE